LQVLYYLYTNIFSVGINGNLSIILESLAFSSVSSISLFVILILLLKYIKNKTNLTDYQRGVVLVGVGLGTILFTYSISFFNHIVAALFGFSAFYVLSIYKTKWRYFVAGFFISLGFLTELPVIFFCFALLLAEIYLVLSKNKSFISVLRDLLVFSLPIVFGIIVLFYYNYSHFGSPFIFGEMLFKAQRVEQGLNPHGFTQNPLYGVYGSLFSPLKGLFFYSPFLLFSILGLRKFKKEQSYVFVLVVSYILIIILTYSFWSDCFGATVFGDRYLVNILPFLGVVLVYSIPKFWFNTYLRNLFLFTVLVSVLSILANSFTGIAQGKYGKCKTYLNTYTPYHRIYDNYIVSPKIKASPVIIATMHDAF